MIALALAAALAQVPAPSPAPVAPAGPGETFQKRCIFCHGEDGRGQTKKGRQLKAPDFTSRRWQAHTADEEIVEAITEGIPKHKMPSFKEKLTGDQIQALVPFLRAFGKPGDNGPKAGNAVGGHEHPQQDEERVKEPGTAPEK